MKKETNTDKPMELRDKFRESLKESFISIKNGLSMGEYISVQMEQFKQAIQVTREETVEEIKKALPTHNPAVLTRNEVKRILDSLTNKN